MVIWKIPSQLELKLTRHYKSRGKKINENFSYLHEYILLTPITKGGMKIVPKIY